jgi:hypothetical protein
MQTMTKITSRMNSQRPRGCHDDHAKAPTSRPTATLECNGETRKGMMERKMGFFIGCRISELCDFIPRMC